MQAGHPLPAEVAYAHVTWVGGGQDVTDEEAATTAVPMCGLWAPTGLTVLPPRHAASLSAADAVHSVAGVLSRSAFWGGKGLAVRLSATSTLEPQRWQQQQLRPTATAAQPGFTGVWTSGNAM